MSRRNKEEKIQLTWIVHITESELVSGCSSPVFKITEKEAFIISLSTEILEEEDYLFCALKRLDLEILYFVRGTVSIKVEDTGYEREMPMDMISTKDSCMEFRLQPVSKIKQFFGAYLLSSTVKLITQFRLQRLSCGSPRIKSLSISSELQLFTYSDFTTTENVIYRSKEKEYIHENINQSENDMEENRIDETEKYIPMECSNFDSSLNGWFYVRYLNNNLHFVASDHLHILDVNGHIHASSNPQKLLFNEETQEHRVHIIKNEDLWKKRELLSRDGEVNLFFEGFIAKELNHISQEWTSRSRRNGDNLRNDLMRYLQGPPKGANLEIRDEGEVHKVHNYVLAARSPVFRDMLSTNMIEKHSKVVNIKEFDSVTLKNFLDYIYFGKFDRCMKWKEFISLYTISHMYLMKSLCHLCSLRLISRISVENSREISVIANLFQDKDLQNTVALFESLQRN